MSAKHKNMVIFPPFEYFNWLQPTGELSWRVNIRFYVNFHLLFGENEVTSVTSEPMMHPGSWFYGTKRCSHRIGMWNWHKILYFAAEWVRMVFYLLLYMSKSMCGGIFCHFWPPSRHSFYLKDTSPQGTLLTFFFGYVQNRLYLPDGWCICLHMTGVASQSV